MGWVVLWLRAHVLAQAVALSREKWLKNDCKHYMSNTYTAWTQFSFVGGNPCQAHVLGALLFIQR